jgi:hypothetical protein
VNAALEELVQTLVFEGYALYPYTPGATKNATPTPFGIVYPPVYAAGSPTTFDRIRMQGVAEAADGATVAVEIRFLEPAGERHEGVERRVALEPRAIAELVAGDGVATQFAFGRVSGRLRLSAQDFGHGITRVCAEVENMTAVAEGLDRGVALQSSFLSTHVIATITGGRFFSPVAPPDDVAAAVMTSVCVNTHPVLATPHDDVLLGAAIFLPDHPQIAPESRGDLFDGTEIEEALLLHLLALSDGERAEIEQQDPAVRAMLERAITTTPEQFAHLRGRITISDPAPALPTDTAGVEVRGEEETTVGGRRFRRGDHVVLRPEAGRNAHDHLLHGRSATIERIYLDYEDGIHLCVTVDDDPGQDIMREIGRYLYFKPAEVEVTAREPA